MMLRPALALALLACTLQISAAEVSGIAFEERVSVAGQALQLNGAGTHIKYQLKAYAIDLYLTQQTNSSTGVFNSASARRIQFVTLREHTAEQFSEALIEYLRKNQNAPDLQKTQPRIEYLRGIMLSVGRVPEKTRIRLDYLPGIGTRLYIGEEQKGKDITGEDFYLALLKIWLGERVPQENLRAALLGKQIS